MKHKLMAFSWFAVGTKYFFSTAGSSCRDVSVRKAVSATLPPLSHKLYKGQCGRIGVVGGSAEYTGAPFFAAISALKVGSDLSHVFCPADAATVIKSYSPELIVHPLLDPAEPILELVQWLDRMHSMVLGPGLGRRADLMPLVRDIILEVRHRNLPLIIDADGLFYVGDNPEMIKGYPLAILTPNVVEFQRLYRQVSGTDPAVGDVESGAAVKELAAALDNVTVVQKGPVDMISNGIELLCVSNEGSPRRCGGQGDLLSGTLGTMAFWALQLTSKSHPAALDKYGGCMIAAYGACWLTRECSRLAYAVNGRSTTTGDLIDRIQQASDNLF